MRHKLTILVEVADLRNRTTWDATKPARIWETL